MPIYLLFFEGAAACIVVLLALVSLAMFAKIDLTVGHLIGTTYALLVASVFFTAASLLKIKSR
jgi:hypothetical protein